MNRTGWAVVFLILAAGVLIATGIEFGVVPGLVATCAAVLAFLCGFATAEND